MRSEKEIEEKFLETHQKLIKEYERSSELGYEIGIILKSEIEILKWVLNKKEEGE